MRCSDWSSDVCSSDPSLVHGTNNDHLDHRSYAARCGNKASEHDRIAHQPFQHRRKKRQHRKNQYAKKKSQQGSKKEIAILEQRQMDEGSTCCQNVDDKKVQEECRRSEEHTSELKSLMRISYAVFCSKKKKTITNE